MASNFFNSVNCPSCGAKIISDLSRCPYCDQEIDFVWKLNPEQEKELSHLIEGLELKLMQSNRSLRMSLIPALNILFKKNKNESLINLPFYLKAFDIARLAKYSGIFLFYFFCFSLLPFLISIILNQILFLFPITATSILFSYILTHFRIRKDFYSREKMIRFAEDILQPEIKSFLNRMNLGWKDFDQFILRKYFIEDYQAFSSIAFLVYRNGRK